MSAHGLTEIIASFYLADSVIENAFVFLTTCKQWNMILASKKCYKQMKICVKLLPFFERGSLTFKSLPIIIFEVSRFGFDASMDNLSSSIAILAETMKKDWSTAIGYKKKVKSVIQLFIWLNGGLLPCGVDKDYIDLVYLAYDMLDKLFTDMDEKVEQKQVQEEELKRWHVFCKKRGFCKIHKKVVYNLKRFFKKDKKCKNTIRALKEKKRKID